MDHGLAIGAQRGGWASAEDSMKRKPSAEQRERRKLKAERRAADRGAVSASMARPPQDSSPSWEFENRPGSFPRRICITLAELTAVARNVRDTAIASVIIQPEHDALEVCCMQN